MPDTMDQVEDFSSFFSEEELTLTSLDSTIPKCPVFSVCDSDQCLSCMQHLEVLYADYTQLWAENRELKIRWKDNVHTLSSQIKILEYHNEQKQRFLDKQTELVEIVSRSKGLDLDGIPGIEEYTSACERCFHHRDMWRTVRSMNLEQQKRCEIEAANARDMQQQQGRQLSHMKMMYSRLQTQFGELRLMKSDPYCKDSEILKLRYELEDAKAMTAGYNKTAFNANNEARSYMEQLEQEKLQCCELRLEVNTSKSELALHKEMISVLKQTASPESEEARQLFTIGECRDLVCRNRQLAINHKVNMLSQQLKGMHDEREHLHEDITRARGDSMHWKKLYDCHQPKQPAAVLQYHDSDSNQAIPAICLDENDPQPLTVQQQVVHVIEQKTQPLVSSIGPRDELTMRMQSLFQLIPGVDAEMDENDMYDEFILDQEPHKREQIIEQIFASCHSGERLPENERKRFHAATTAKNNSIRSCKRSFSACLRAIGGVMSKKRSRNVWLNFRQTRAPIFKWSSSG
jgi:hypothetical protein